MPRRRQPVRLYLREARNDSGGVRGGVWYIVDGPRSISTHASEADIGKAQKALADYCADRHEPPSGVTAPKALLVDEVITIYLREHAEGSRSKEWIAHMAGPILHWWSGKTLGDIHKVTCRDYVKWRTEQAIKQQSKKAKAVRKVSDQTARHELSVLSAAVHYFHEDPNHGPLDAMPVIEMPPKAGQREDYFLTREQIAERVHAARRKPETRHVARMLLIGFYSGTRPGAILRLAWLPSTAGGWIDVDAGILHRKPARSQESNKRQPRAKLHHRLLCLARYWRKAERRLLSGQTDQNQAAPVLGFGAA